MRRIALLFAGIVALTCATVEAANAQRCIRDDYGRVICGEPVHRDYYRGYGDEYYGYRRPRPHNAPPGPGDWGPQTSHYRDCFNYRGSRICCPKGWTVQNGRCQPYPGY
jgi:hypothetical protein